MVEYNKKSLLKLENDIVLVLAASLQSQGFGGIFELYVEKSESDRSNNMFSLFC